MTLFRSILVAVFVFMIAGQAAAEECAFGVSDGGPGQVGELWILQVSEDVARATGAAALSARGSANIYLEINRSDAAARASKTYKSFITVNYFPEAPPPRSLKATLDIGGSAREFTVEEKKKDRSTSTIDLAALYPELIGAIRKGELAHLTIFDGDKKFIEQYFRKSLKNRFTWMEEDMDRIFAQADAGKCPDTPAPAPPSGGGGGTGGGMGLL